MTASDVYHAGLLERLRSSEPLPLCPYDRRSPLYWVTDDKAPCTFCGTLNEEGAPDLCKGADTRLFSEAAQAIEALAAERNGLLAVVKRVAAHPSPYGLAQEKD